MTRIAVRVGDLIVSVPARGRHGTILKPLYEKLGWFVEEPRDQGLLTSEGRFVERVEAREIAVAAGQLLPRHHPGLYSEDLW